jgi:hypothetical protein
LCHRRRLRLPGLAELGERPLGGTLEHRRPLDGPAEDPARRSGSPGDLRVSEGGCGVKHWRQLAPNGFHGWSSPVFKATGCLTRFAVERQGERTELFAHSNRSLGRFSRAFPDIPSPPPRA